MLKVLDLFSGIGGFSLGLERTGGFETVAFCEIEKFPRKVLAKHWPDVPCFNDVRTLKGHDVGSVDVICGGFPCQDISVAGKQGGIGNGTRSGLYSEVIRLIGELRPNYVILENVANLLSGPREKRGGWFGRILGDLAECGYDAEWENIPASAVGAPHRRERVWVIAYPNEIGCERGVNRQILRKPGITREPVRGFEEWAIGRSIPSPRTIRANDGIPSRVDRNSALGNSIYVDIATMIGNAILETHRSAS